MKALFLLLLLVVVGKLVAQVPRKMDFNPDPVPLREVSGIVLDSTGVEVAGAVVSLQSKTDSLTISTNADGVYVFKNVKSAVFYLTVSSLGFKPVTRHLLNNDATTKIILDPFILTSDSRVLEEVKIGGTPRIMYKTDTVEYRAADYKVRENAMVDELLKRMEGMEVGRDGSLAYQGQTISSARLNGKDFLGGDVATTIQNLPAEIVEKIQIVDDYGDQAARSGIKDGDPRKIVNITTKADRSIGNMARMLAAAGENERYTAQLFGTRINADQVIGLNANLINTVTGVANPETSARGEAGLIGDNNDLNASFLGSGGTTQTVNPTFSYRNTWGDKVDVNVNYGYSNSEINSINKVNSQQFSELGTTFFANNDNNAARTKNHELGFDFEYAIDRANFLRVSPKLSYRTTFSTLNLSLAQSGLIHQSQKGTNGSSTIVPNIGGLVFYQHIFNKKGRNFTLQLSSDVSDQDNDEEQNINIIYYGNGTEHILKDSLIHRLILNKNRNKNYRASTTFTEALHGRSQLQFNGQVNYRGYDNSKITSTVFSDGLSVPIDSLNAIYDYSFTEIRLALNYRFTEEKYNLSLGMNAIPTVLTGNKANVITRRSDFNLIPIFRFQYLWSNQHQFQIHYSGSPLEPTFNQLQPVRDVSNPQSPVVGNPNLKSSFMNTVRATYNHYLANSRFNYSVNINSIFINNKVARNIILIQDAYNSLKYETHFLNMNDNYSLNANYSLSKQFADRKYYLSLNGAVNTIHATSMSNGVKNATSTWRFYEQFGPRMRPAEWMEINPYVSFDYIKSTNSIPSAIDIRTSTLSFTVDGKLFFSKGLHVGYFASKNYVNGIHPNITKNPFVINTYLEKHFFNKTRATLRVQVFDLFNQNNFVNRRITETSIIDTETNPMSRYFMITFSMNLQKWSGSPQRNGIPLMRRGDGSFIN